MLSTTIPFTSSRQYRSAVKSKRVESIDLLRGTVMIIMAIDHVRDYFHSGAFQFSPTDLSKTSVFLFFTRLITHYCAPVFVFLAGVSAHLYGVKRTRAELSFFLLTRGIWLALAEMGIITLEQTFNPGYPMFNLQVIWAIGISMIVLSALVYLDRRIILAIALLLVVGHNLLDTVHVPGDGLGAFLWSLCHEVGTFTFGPLTFFVHYPVIPWIGIMAAGYCLGHIYTPGFAREKRKTILLWLGFGSLAVFLLLRLSNVYGDASHWSVQKNTVFTFLSILNVTKYPPSLLYALMTLGPAFLFLAVSERPLNKLTSKIAVFGRVPMFYYIVHLFLIHLFAVAGAALSGYHASDMILTTRLNSSPELNGYGFNLATVYAVWAVLIVILYPICRWFDRYKRKYQGQKWWLSYL